MTALYWLKRDFRFTDNIALSHAIQENDKVIPIFILEPSFLDAPETSAFHLHAINNALTHLRKELQPLKKDIIILKGEVVETLEQLYATNPFQKIYAHEEIGNLRTYERDLAVHDWCKNNKVDFIEHRQTGVFRRLNDRNKRHQEWKEFTNAKLFPPIENFSKLADATTYKKLSLPSSKLFHTLHKKHTLNKTQRSKVQAVSEADADATLQSFLNERGVDYRGGISSPLTAFHAGSRLSVHLAWGTITGRRVYQSVQQRMEELAQLKAEGDPTAGKWRASLRNFLSRLHWRDHFIQRLESEPTMELHALNPAYDALEYDNDPAFFAAWKSGLTGFPMVDACIRCLQNTGFLNFRMRAMLTSFACHTLHLDWKMIDHPMAQFYTDYEPGIHLSQLQMQASVVGINTVRIYSPTKQIIDQDPETKFIKEFVPELRAFSAEEIISHREEPLGDYPGQIVDWKTASAEMRSRIYAVRKRKDYRAIADKVYQKHGSRRSRPQKKKPTTASVK